MPIPRLDEHNSISVREKAEHYAFFLQGPATYRSGEVVHPLPVPHYLVLTPITALDKQGWKVEALSTDVFALNHKETSTPNCYVSTRVYFAQKVPLKRLVTVLTPDKRDLVDRSANPGDWLVRESQDANVELLTEKEFERRFTK